MSKIAIVTGSAGLIGAESVRFLSSKGYRVVGIDNDMRREFFGDDASTRWSREQLQETVPGYCHESLDIRHHARVEPLFAELGSDIDIVVHTAAQPSHDWAATAPFVDFSVNANGTLVLLELVRKYCPKASFIFTSTNKVYGDNPNRLPLVEQETRFELHPSHPFAQHGIDESMSVDQTRHSLFGVSKLAADALVQEYGRYFGINTVCFRGGCLTGPGHSGTRLHGFLSYLVKCCITGEPYTVYGYRAKQVRDNIHSLDLVRMFWEYHRNPKPGAVYNAGGGRFSNCSMTEAIAICERLVGRSMNVSYSETPRIGDHIWYISDTRRFQADYPNWKQQYGIEDILTEICDAAERHSREPAVAAAI
ncbi:MAG: NAD-dependent epimerase/dehydratase family protein [Planctomycetaceae bacterium]